MLDDNDDTTMLNGLAPLCSHHLISRIILCVPVTTVSTRAALRSAARGDLECCPSYQATSLQPGILRRRSYIVEQFAVCHQIFQLLRLYLLSSIDSRLIYSSNHITQHKFECRMLYGALVETLDDSSCFEKDQRSARGTLPPVYWP